MSSPSVPVITRFAPSPSGHLHIGGARTALFCWAFAKARGGHFLLRLEDTDQSRSSEASAKAILEDLAWLGIDWDEGPEIEFKGRTVGGDPRSVAPFAQSERRDLYNEHIDRLIGEGKAYYAFDRAEELAAKRDAAQREKKQYRYDRAAMQIPEAERAERVANGEPHVVRLRMPDDEGVSVKDEVLGEVSFAPGELDDFIIRKMDGYPTYHFAVVVDDALMGVTHVLRGQEHLNNTPRHVALQKALGFDTPVYAHMPLIFNDKGAKMSKRERDSTVKEIFKRRSVEEVYAELPEGIIGEDELAEWSGDKKAQLEGEVLDRLADALGILLPEVSVEDFRKAGYLPEVITNFISLLGWTPSKQDGADREKFDMDFLAKDFDISRIGKSNARFDRAKLMAFNTDVITQLPADEFVERFAGYCKDYEPAIVEKLSGESFRVLALAVQPQCKTFFDAARRCVFAVTPAAEIVYDEKAVKKNLTRNDAAGLGVLRDFRGVLADHEDWSTEPLSKLVADYCERNGIGMGMVAQPIRVAVTGTPVSPPIGETLAALGKSETLDRIDRCVVECQRLLAAGV